MVLVHRISDSPAWGGTAVTGVVDLKRDYGFREKGPEKKRAEKGSDMSPGTEYNMFDKMQSDDGMRGAASDVQKEKANATVNSCKRTASGHQTAAMSNKKTRSVSKNTLKTIDCRLKCSETPQSIGDGVARRASHGSNFLADDLAPEPLIIRVAGFFGLMG